MTQSVAQLFKQLDQLSEEERFEFRDLFLQQHEEMVKASYVGEDLTEEDFTHLAEATFRALDLEEEDAAKA